MRLIGLQLIYNIIFNLVQNLTLVIHFCISIISRPGYTGNHCQIDIDECQMANQPCQNGATCHNLMNQYQCSCPLGFTGLHCQVNIDDCSSMPCSNNGTCYDQVNAYTCSCQAGWTGKDCSVDQDECLLNSCQNGATCIDQLGNYTCQCTAEFTGSLCQQSKFILSTKVTVYFRSHLDCYCSVIYQL